MYESDESYKSASQHTTTDILKTYHFLRQANNNETENTWSAKKIICPTKKALHVFSLYIEYQTLLILNSVRARQQEKQLTLPIGKQNLIVKTWFNIDYHVTLRETNRFLEALHRNKVQRTSGLRFLHHRHSRQAPCKKSKKNKKEKPEKTRKKKNSNKTINFK